MEQASNAVATRRLEQIIHQPSELSGMNGDFPADKSANVERWRKHFEHLNFDTRPITPLFPSTTESPPSPTYAVPYDALSDAIQRLRNNKEPRDEAASAETYIFCTENLAHWLHEAIKQAWREEVVHND
ncbi:unnamed protein product [Schistocephalus solidus]|uniref:Uncharacterized protein n=1 Tax=Schistocephalus solidus TaxID=70667 RepID=A0A183TGD3_SCHSO|nr:unnamed protein product [Schistocephalus solidus]